MRSPRDIARAVRPPVRPPDPPGASPCRLERVPGNWRHWAERALNIPIEIPERAYLAFVVCGWSNGRGPAAQIACKIRTGLLFDDCIRVVVDELAVLPRKFERTLRMRVVVLL